MLGKDAENFINDIDTIDSAYKKFDTSWKKYSLEEKVKKVFRSSAIIGFTTDIMGEKWEKKECT